MPNETQSRAIDAVPPPGPDSKEMEVLCLGLSRTATMSLKTALDKLGYRTYHCQEVGQISLPDEHHIRPWLEALRAKTWGNGRVFGREEFERLLRNHSAVTDVPCACFPDELMEAYPDAKVILSTRDPDRWLASMETSYFAILESKGFRWWRALAAVEQFLLGDFMELLRACLIHWTRGDWTNRSKLRQAFIDHNEHVRAITPQERLLEWTPKDGWEPICRHLGKEIPAEEFPNVNKGDNAAGLVWKVGLIVLYIQWLKWPSIALGGVVVGSLGAWWFGIGGR